METRTIELKGNELEWILKLAENHYMSDEFRNKVKEYKMDKLDEFLANLLSRFHPNNFNFGWKDMTWTLTNNTSEQKVTTDE